MLEKFKKVTGPAPKEEHLRRKPRQLSVNDVEWTGARALAERMGMSVSAMVRHLVAEAWNTKGGQHG
jgi:hypothetical protein